MKLSIENLFNVKDKVVVVTGGGTGIGQMMATGFVHNGANVYVASRSKETCEQTAEKLNAEGPGKCTPLQADLSTEEGCKEFAAEVAKRESKIDVLINNSGVAIPNTYEGHTQEIWDKTYSLNVMGTFFVCRELLPLLDNAATSVDGARILNVGSMTGVKPQDLPTIAYETSKAAVHHLTRKMAADLARRPNGGHILVNAVAPGLVPTSMTQAIPEVTGLSLDKIAEGIPTGRSGDASDMAGIALFFGSRASGWVSGMVLMADGGMVFADECKVGGSKTPR